MISTVTGIKVVSAALSAMGSSMSSAFARIDTMEQFNRTMTVLTGSSQLADTALESIRSTVTGTAYGLDVAAKSVQSFVTSGMDITTASGQIEGLANAVSFYGDGTNSTLESVANAWGKMATSGKVYAADVKTLLNAGIPVWEIYAAKVGMSVEEVQKSTSSGAISAQEFQVTLIEALNEGAGAFPSIANAAKDAGASWQGTFDNMQAATTRGVMNIIQAIDNNLIKSGLPDLRESISLVGKTFESMLNTAAGVAGKLVSVVSPAIKLIAANLNTVIPIAGTFFALWKGTQLVSFIDKAGGVVNSLKLITTAFAGASIAKAKDTIETAALIAMYTKDAAVKAASTVATYARAAAEKVNAIAIGLTTGHMKLSTVATLAWNAALNANPAAVIAISVGALATALGVVVRKFSSAAQSAEMLIKTNKTLKDDYKTLTSQVGESKAAHDSNVSSIDAEIGASKKLVDQVYELATAENKSIEDKQALAAYVDLLNDSMAGLNLQYDAENDALNQTREAIDAVVAAREQQAKAEALRERYIEIAREQVLVEEQLSRAMDQRAAIEAQFENGTITWNQRGAAIQGVSKQIDELIDIQDDLQASTDYLSEVFLENQQVQEAVAAATAEAWTAANGEIMASQEDMIAKNEDIAAALEDYVGAVTDMFSAISEEAKGSVSEYLDTLDHNFEASQRFVENLENLEKAGLDAAIVQTWREAGLDSAGEVALWADATEEQIQALNEAMARNMEQGTQDAVAVWEDSGIPDAISGVFTEALDASQEKIADFMGFGSDVVSGLAEGIDSTAGTAVDSITNAAGQVDDAFTSYFLIQSPSKLYSDHGSNLMAGLAEGVQSAFQQVVSAMDAAMKAVESSVITGVANLPSRFYDTIIPSRDRVTEWGNQLLSAGEQGAKSFFDAVINSIADLPSKFYDTIKPAVDQVQNWVSQLVSTASSQLPNFVTTAVNTVKPIVDEFKTIGVNMVEGLWAGLDSRTSWFYANLSNFFQQIVAQAKAELDISSPSKKFMDIGVDIARGVIVGLESMEAAVERTMADIFNPDLDFEINAKGNYSHGQIPDFGGVVVPVSAAAGKSDGQAVGNTTINVYVETPGVSPGEISSAITSKVAYALRSNNWKRY